MNRSSGSRSGSRRSGGAIVLGIVLLLVAGLAIGVGRGWVPNPFGGGDPGEDAKTVRAIIGSEKKPFFEDPEVKKALAKHGYAVEVETAGSRRMAVESDLSGYDIAFPSSAPAAEKILRDQPGASRHDVFYSPMAIATFEPIVSLLESEGVASRSGEAWQIDITRLLEMQSKGVRWRDLGDGAFPSPRTVQVSTTDIRTSNSAAMYLALASWVANDGAVVSSPDEAEAVFGEVTPLFTGQGYTESSSAGPFRDYISQGMGSKPMVMIYESQFLGEAADPAGRIRDDMVLAYPSPTVLSTHVALGLSDDGTEVARLLAEDPDLQELAARHGYRTSAPGNMDVLAESLPPGRVPPASFIDSVDPPTFEMLERLIDGVSQGYRGPPKPETEEG